MTYEKPNALLLGLATLALMLTPTSTAFALCAGGAPNSTYEGGAGEECDDGNTDNDDGCTSDCTIEADWYCDEPSGSSTSSCNRGPVTSPILIWEAICSAAASICDISSCNVSTTVDTESSITDPDGDDLAGEFLCVHDPAGIQNPFLPTDLTFQDPWAEGALNGAPDFEIIVTPNDPCAPSCYELVYNIPDKGFPNVDSGDEGLVICYNDPPTLTGLTGLTAPNGTLTIGGSAILSNTNVNVIDGGLDASSIAVSTTETGSYGASAVSEDGGGCSIVAGDLVYAAPNSAAASPDRCWVRICEANPGPIVLCDSAEFEFTVAGCTNNAACTDDTKPICNTMTEVCESCATDMQCDALTANDLPVCNTDGSCVECTDVNDAKCPGVCDDALNVCDPCTVNSDCLVPALPICDATNGICVECLMNGDCAGQICNQNTNLCESCVDDSQCGGMTPICDAAGSGTCIECLQNDDCDGEVCNTGANQCEPCTTSTDCAANAEAVVCDEGLCVECGENADCPDGGRCDASGVCQECIVDEHCTVEPNTVCFANSCVPDENAPECCERRRLHRPGQSSLRRRWGVHYARWAHRRCVSKMRHESSEQHPAMELRFGCWHWSA